MSNSTLNNELLIAIKNNDLPRAERLLINEADPNYRYSSGENLMLSAVFDRQFPVLKLLISHGGNIYLYDNNAGQNLIHYAVRADEIEIVKYLLSLGVSASHRDMHGQYALHFAVVGSIHKIIEHIIDADSDLNKINHNGELSLHLATTSWRAEVVDLLLEKMEEVIVN